MRIARKAVLCRIRRQQYDELFCAQKLVRESSLEAIIAILMPSFKVVTRQTR